MRMETSQTLDHSYHACAMLARAHYENFPVASRLLPTRMRPHVAAVYAFARIADDIADEGEGTTDERLAALSYWKARLDGEPSEESGAGWGQSRFPSFPQLHTQADLVFPAVRETIRRFEIPATLFRDLLDAFAQDCSVRQYATFADVLDYCRRSANPVGRILLTLSGATQGDAPLYSDALCTGLQLANFWQDVSVDALKPRLYIPLEDCERFGVDIADITAGRHTNAFAELMRFEVDRARACFADARPLFASLSGLFAIEIRAVWHGGMRILEKIERDRYTVVVKRPTLTKVDSMSILLRALFPMLSSR